MKRYLYMPGLFLVRRFPDLWLRSASSRTKPADKAPGGGTADAAQWPEPLPLAIREETLEPFRQGIRGHAWDVRLCGHRWGFRPGATSGVEVYLWHGEGDQLVPVAAARALAAAIPGCHFTFYPGEGHDLGSHIREIFAALTADESREPDSSVPQM